MDKTDTNPINFEFCKEQNDEVRHGTTINKIIRWHNKTAILINIKILQYGDTINVSDLINVLRYIDKNIECNIINISMSYNLIEDVFMKKSLEDICNRLTNKNVIIVSAFDNLGSISYPAAFKCVIGVTSGDYCRKNNDIEYVYNDMVNICGKGNNQIVTTSEYRDSLVSGNSLACAHVSGIISTIINYYDGKDSILKKLEKIAIIKHNFKNSCLKKVTLYINIKKLLFYLLIRKSIH